MARSFGVALVALVGVLAPRISNAEEPALALRLEGGGALGLSSETSDHGLAVHFGGRLSYALVPTIAAGIRVGASFFPPKDPAADFVQAAYEVGLTFKPSEGPWADGYLGLHEMRDERAFGLQLAAGYDLKLGSSGAGLGPFLSYSFAMTDKAQHFLRFGLGGTFGLAGVSLSEDELDPDGDAVVGAADRCPDEAEDTDGHEDDDGCPDPDNDGDRVLDANDQCVDDAEDADGFEDEDGCPDLDNDHDNVPDTTDRCPLEAEDRDGFEDEDGCIDADNDDDGVADDADRCVAEAEDRDGWQDDDGCPDADNDGDGKPDSEDACPNEPQTGTSTDGCPQRIRVRDTGVELLEPIKFRGRNLDPASNGVLDDLAAILRAPNGPSGISLEVHMHPRGAAAALQTISQARADALKAALVSRQVPADHITATGVGGQNPAAEGNSSAARQQNERVVVTFTR